VIFTTTPPSQQTTENVYEASTLDGTSFSESCPVTSTTGATGTLTGTVDASAISGASFLNIDALSGTAQSSDYLSSPGGNFSFAAPVGTDRVAVVAFNSVLTNSGETFSVLAAKNFSSQTVPGALNGGNTVVLGAADETTLEPLTYNNVPSGYGAPSTAAAYNMGGDGGFILTNAATSEYPALPAGAVQSGDYYYFSAVAYGGTSNLLGEVIVTMTSASAGPVSLTFPPAWSYAGPTAATWPSFDLSYAGFSGQTGVYDGVSMNWSSSSTAENYILVTATGNYLDGSTTVAVPDLSGGTGFLSAPASGTDVIWEADISQGNFPSLQPLPLNGTVKAVSTLGTYVVP
jgi:hypothetical protein